MSASKPAAPEPEEIAGRFQILKTLGAGAFGTVYKARDKVLGRPLAIKTIRMEGLAASQTSQTEMLDRFLREAKVASNLKHPNIVTIYDFGESQGLSYIAMEFIDGVGLDRIIGETGRMPVERAAALGAQVADALDYAYRHQKLVHRDIKPANIMIEAGDHVKVTDFGIAKGALSTDLTQTGSLLGTPSYMSPEQARGNKDLDGRSDLFSLGCVLYEMVGGVKAFRGDSITALLFKIITEEPQPIRELDPSVPDEYLRIVAKALSKAPETRYQTGREVADDLLALTRPGFVPTLRQIDVPTVPGGQAPTNVPTIAVAPTSQVTVSSAPTIGRPAGASATVPATTTPVGPTQLITPTGPAAPTGVTVPPPPRAATATGARRPQAPTVPAARRAGGGAGLLIGLGLAGLVVVAVVAAGAWYLLSHRASSPEAVSSPPPEATTRTVATPAPVEGTPAATQVASAGSPAASAPTPGTAAFLSPPAVAPPPRSAAAGARPASTKPAPTTASADRGAGTATADQSQAPSGGIPAASGYSSLDEPPSDMPDGREAGEALAQKYRSGGSNGMGATRYHARPRVPRDLAPAERPAAGTLFHLLSAEGAYHRQSGRYGSLHELHAAGFLRLDVPVGRDAFRRAQYQFTVKVEGDAFRAEARPLAAGRAFFVDDSGYILPVE